MAEARDPLQSIAALRGRGLRSRGLSRIETARWSGLAGVVLSGSFLVFGNTEPTVPNCIASRVKLLADTDIVEDILKRGRMCGFCLFARVECAHVEANVEANVAGGRGNMPQREFRHRQSPWFGLRRFDDPYLRPLAVSVKRKMPNGRRIFTPLTGWDQVPVLDW